MNGLIITLGHNSSAVYFKNNKVVCGYEEERLSHVKSDSAFPILAINSCLNFAQTNYIDHIYVSWWNDLSPVNYHDAGFSDKHYNNAYIRALCKEYHSKLILNSSECTHHDAHAYAALNFFENNVKKCPYNANKDAHVLVMDGFGTDEEVFSIYKKNGTDNQLSLIERDNNYFHSLALMYQYATNFVGMKMNEDEYKFLGYESHIMDIFSDKYEDGINLMLESVTSQAKQFLDGILQSSNETSPSSLDHIPYYINTTKLKTVQELWNTRFTDVLASVSPLICASTSDTIPPNSFTGRVIIGFYIQAVVEEFIKLVIKQYKIKNLIVSGGIFYNVKLNNTILNNIPGYICVYPLAGDQGAGIGMFRKLQGTTLKYDDLYWGIREIDEEETKYILTENIYNVPKSALPRIIDIENYDYEDKDSTDRFISIVTELLLQNKIVNVMTGNMEYGPRALCNTTTLALPTKENVSYINELNNRNDVMPMAPVIHKDNFTKFFDDRIYDRVVGSLQYMILTTDHIKPIDDKYEGITHKYPTNDTYSSRCQVVGVDNSVWISKLMSSKKLEGQEFIINTSFNYHGLPICYSVDDAVKHFGMQCEHDVEERNYLVIF